MFARLFRPGPATRAGRALYASAVGQARSRAFYETLGAPDTTEGRFELYNLHVAMLLLCLKRRGLGSGDVAQALFDAYVTALDDALREMGVGDLSVGKKMRKLGEAIYGRARSLETALSAEAAADDLADFLRRTTYADAADAPAPRLAAYVRRAMLTLGGMPDGALAGGEALWPDPAAAA